MKLIVHILTAVVFSALLHGAGLPSVPEGKKPVRREVSFPPLPELVPRFRDTIAVRPPLLPPRRLRMIFAGDVMQHMPQVASARRADGSFDYDPVFEYIAPYFKNADLALVNLETTLTDKSDYAGYPCFRSPEALAEALRRAGAGVCVLANNHCCDNGARGIRMTIAALDRCGIAHTGVFADSADYRAHHPLRLKVNGIGIALLNYTYGTNGTPTPKGMIVNRIDTVTMVRDLKAVRDGNCDCIVVFIHWGNEYERQASKYQLRLAEFLRRHGADVVIGSHPHVVQPFAADSAGVVFYSLGNFVSNQRGRYTDGGLMAEVNVTRFPDGRMHYDATAIPVWVSLPGYRILPEKVADTMEMPVWMRAQYERFREDTHALLYQ